MYVCAQATESKASKQSAIQSRCKHYTFRVLGFPTAHCRCVGRWILKVWISILFVVYGRGSFAGQLLRSRDVAGILLTEEGSPSLDSQEQLEAYTHLATLTAT